MLLRPCLFRILVAILYFSSLFFICNNLMSIGIIISRHRHWKFSEKKPTAAGWNLQSKYIKKYTRSSILVKLQLSQLLFRGFWVRLLENLFSRADFSGPNQISLIMLTKTFWKQLQQVFCEKRFFKIVARKLASWTCV